LHSVQEAGQAGALLPIVGKALSKWHNASNLQLVKIQYINTMLS